MENKVLAELIMEVMNKSYADISVNRTAFDDSAKAMEAYGVIREFVEKYFPDKSIYLTTEVYNK